MLPLPDLTNLYTFSGNGTTRRAFLSFSGEYDFFTRFAEIETSPGSTALRLESLGSCLISRKGLTASDDFYTSSNLRSKIIGAIFFAFVVEDFGLGAFTFDVLFKVITTILSVSLPDSTLTAALGLRLVSSLRVFLPLRPEGESQGVLCPPKKKKAVSNNINCHLTGLFSTAFSLANHLCASHQATRPHLHFLSRPNVFE